MDKQKEKGREAGRRICDSRGASVITVMIAIALVGILVTVVIYAATMNFYMMQANQGEKENFYTAEQALDEIRAGLEEKMGEALDSAYSYVMQRYTVTQGMASESLRKTMFDNRYIKVLQDSLMGEDGNTYSLELLESFLSASREQAGTLELSSQEDCRMEVSGEKGLVLRGIRLVFVDKAGRASVISTDLVLGIPEIRFTQSSSVPALADISLMAGDSLTLSGIGEHRLMGSIYAGLSGMTVETAARATFSGGERLVTGGEILLQPGSSLATEEKETVWAGGITVNGATLTLKGRTFLEDDLTVNEENSRVTIGGSYYGFGSRQGLKDAVSAANHPEYYKTKSSEQLSSAVIINGKNTTLDFSSLDRLLLAGNAYLKVSAEDSGLLLGESLSVKSNQLAYLIPGDVIGDGTWSNPMTESQYKSLMDWASGSGMNVVNYTKASPALGGNTLSGLGVNQYKQIVYQNTGGSPLVYFYASFQDAKEASRYFNAYYHTAEGSRLLNKYLSFYVNNDHVVVRDPDSFLRYTTNGNVLVPAEEASRLYPITADSDGSQAMEEQASYRDMFYALNRKMIVRYEALIKEDGRDETLPESCVTDNLVDFAAVKAYIARHDREDGAADGIYRFSTKDGLEAWLVDTGHPAGAGRFALTEEAAENTRLIICVGDLTMEEGVSFAGTLIVSGSARLEGECSLTAAPEDMARVFQAAYGLGGETAPEDKRPMDFFWEGSEYAQNSASSGLYDEQLSNVISLRDKITNENYRKE